MNRAYSVFHAKELDDGQRTFSGWATTPATDRLGDTINPMGVRFRNPLALLHQHDSRSPIGIVRFQKATEEGIKFDAEIARIDEPPSLKERVDVAWAEIKHGLVRAVSIGFRPLRHEYNKNGGIDFEEIEVFELSSVTIPALPEAVITSVKSMQPLSNDMVREISRFDLFTSGAVPLVRLEKNDALPKGAVRLISP
jgi:HK97 family phage prohead protease